jgi:uroporphyrinogen decarboxylase
MTPEQWEKLLAVMEGGLIEPLPVGFIIDSPWLPGWAGTSTSDYFSSDRVWFDANLKAVERFPDIMFLPGFWAEFGMCTEPSAFGAECSCGENALPHPGKIISDIKGIDSINKPNPKTDGLLPSVLNRLKRYQHQIEQAGHAIKFAVSRGPLTVASFVLDTTEFLTAIRTNPDKVHKLMETITGFIIDWLEVQMETFSSIDGVFILDDIVGFLGPDDFKEMALPYLSRIFRRFDVSVKFFHNDAAGLVCAPHLAGIGVNLFNFSYRHTLEEMRSRAGAYITLLGNIPPRDVMAAGVGEDVSSSVRAAIDAVQDKRRIILSCGGGMPPGVPTENIEVFLSAAGYESH